MEKILVLGCPLCCIGEDEATAPSLRPVQQGHLMLHRWRGEFDQAFGRAPRVPKLEVPACSLSPALGLGVRPKFVNAAFLEYA